jgi:hypothetical protein
MKNVSIVDRHDYKGGYKTGCDIEDKNGKRLARIRSDGRGRFYLTDERDRVTGIPPKFAMQRGTKKSLIAAFLRHLDENN